jgi:hypothetical protein
MGQPMPEKKSVPVKELELHTDAWKRFECAIDVVAKSPPQHRTKSAKKRKKRPPHKPTPR